MSPNTYEDGFAAYGNGQPVQPREDASGEWMRGWMDARTDSFRNGGSLYPSALGDTCPDCGGMVSDDGYTIDRDRCCFTCKAD